MARCAWAFGGPRLSALRVGLGWAALAGRGRRFAPWVLGGPVRGAGFGFDYAASLGRTSRLILSADARVATSRS